MEVCKWTEDRELRNYAIGGSIVAAGLITMLVCGILGSQGKIPMTKLGARFCVRFPLILSTLAILYILLTPREGETATCTRFTVRRG